MRSSILVALSILALIAGCEREPKPDQPAVVAESRDEIPNDQLGPVLHANRLGIGHLERFEYPEAIEHFRTVRRLAPGWIAGSINLSIALLNDSGAKSEDQKKAGGGEVDLYANFTEVLTLLDEVIRREPGHCHAHYCRGIVLEYLQASPSHPDSLVRANDDFRIVTELDKTDANSWYKRAMTLYDPETKDDPEGARPAGIKQVREKIDYLTKALELNPYLVPALYSLHLSYGFSGDRSTQRTLIARLNRINPLGNAANPGEMVANAYGEQGRYARAIDLLPAPPPTNQTALPPRFDHTRPITVSLPEGDRWVRSADLTGDTAVIGRARARFGSAVAAFDADADGRTDLYLAASVVGPNGVRDALLLNRGGGAFEDVTRSMGLPLDRPSLGVAAADFDADRRVDLFLTGAGGNRLLRNLGKARFEDLTKVAKLDDSTAISLTARWMDIDQDGDLDLYVVNYTDLAHINDAFTSTTPPGLANVAYRNDGQPKPIGSLPESNWVPLAPATAESAATEGLSIAFTRWPDSPLLGAGASPHTGVAFLDLDGDRDLDLVASGDGHAPVALLNDRLGAFRSVSLADLGSGRVNGLLVADFDKDGSIDLAAIGREGRVTVWKNTTITTETGAVPGFRVIPTDANRWRTAIAGDLDLDTWTDLIGLPDRQELAPLGFARNQGDRLATIPLDLAPDGERALVGFTLTDLAGDALPDLLTVRDGEAPRLAVNLGNGRRWVALGLGGRWKVGPDQMRTNSEGLGTRVSIQGEGLDVEYVQTTPSAGTGQSATPTVLGLGSAKEIALLHLRWPDGVIQCELNLPTDTTHTVAEYSRKTGSCPVLFTWNGDRFDCLGDFLGGGGLGYLVAPGAYGQPDRDESVAIAPDQLKAVDGCFRIAISEPMDELAYLDKLTLQVIDRPPGVRSTPDERFAPDGPRPSGETLAWSRTVEPIKVADQSGRDITATLRSWDRSTADHFQRLKGWIGYAEDHAITLDFGDRLAGFGPTDRLVLCLAGWVEYPYSQTNYAAATAGQALRPPVLERQAGDGSWSVLNPSPGYPAGMPRMMTIDLGSGVAGPRCVLRLRTNMECYYDQAFVAVIDATGRIVTSSLPVARAALGYRGYTREVSPDGRLPLLYDYQYVDPAPLARLAGKLTRYGDVARLLTDDDDHLCLVGPGDEVRVEFDASGLPPLEAGWTRSYVLRAIGYCKDADPFTATSDTVGPLPWKGMPPFPFSAGVSRPSDPAYEAYLREYQTRSAATR